MVACGWVRLVDVSTRADERVHRTTTAHRRREVQRGAAFAAALIAARPRIVHGNALLIVCHYQLHRDVEVVVLYRLAERGPPLGVATVH